MACAHVATELGDNRHDVPHVVGLQRLLHARDRDLHVGFLAHESHLDVATAINERASETAVIDFYDSGALNGRLHHAGDIDGAAVC